MQRLGWRISRAEAAYSSHRTARCGNAAAVGDMFILYVLCKVRRKEMYFVNVNGY